MPSSFSHLSDSATKEKKKKKKEEEKKKERKRSSWRFQGKITTQRYSHPKANKQKWGHVLSNN